MTPVVHASVLVGALAFSALAGPWMLRRAAPALMRTPRLAIGLLIGSIVAWLAALLALGPILAWVMTGPALLPGSSAEVCQRCLLAANPSGGPVIETIVPVVLLLALPAVAVLFHAVSTVRDGERRRRATRRTARQLRARAAFRELHGHRVLVADDRHAFALALPRRHGGIVISTRAIELLTPDETAAVLAHEHAHLQQHHHLITAIAQALTRRLRWVPLLAAAVDALGHYQEIAADDNARQRIGTPALASALLRLGEHSGGERQLQGALHAVGPDRVRHLVQRGSGMTGVISTAAASCCLAALAAVGFAVHLPYLAAALTGCA